MPSRIFSLAAMVSLAACGSGSIRPSGDTGTIAPAPSPAPSPPVDLDPAPAPTPAPEAPTGPPAARADTGPPGPASDVEIRRIGRWISSRIEGTRRLVVRDPDNWSRFWGELGAGIRPEVDFTRDLVIAVASGQRKGGGHDIVVQRVSRSDGQLRIEVLETSPGPECMTTAALTQPVDVVVVSGQGVTGWSFIDSSATGGC